jgi:hypothetical protein
MPLRTTPLTVSKEPPITIFPSACRTIELTSPTSLPGKQIEIDILEIGVEAAIVIESHYVVPGRSVETGEFPTYEYLTILLDDNRMNFSISSAHSILKTWVQTAVPIHPRDSLTASPVDTCERSAENDFAIGLQRNRIDPETNNFWLEGHIERAVHVESFKAEVRTDDNFSVRLYGKSVYCRAHR